MSNFQIVVVVGSLCCDLINCKLVFVLQKLVLVEVIFKYFDIGVLFFYNQDDDVNQVFVVVQMKVDIVVLVGVMFVMLEYNCLVFGVLKNVLDNCLCFYGYSVWVGKLVGVVGVLFGVIGVVFLQVYLWFIFVYLDMFMLGQFEVFIQWKDGLVDVNGEIGEVSCKFFQGWMDKFIVWVKIYQLV